MNEKAMTLAIEVARKAAALGEYSVGAVVCIEDTGEILSVEHGRMRQCNDPSAHAEIQAIRAACKKRGNLYLPDACLYTTLEPCPMCVSCAIWAKMKAIVFGATTEDALKEYQKREGTEFDWRQISIRASDVASKGLPAPVVSSGFMREQCLELLALV